MNNFLAIDIGNTHITVGVYEGDRLIVVFSINSKAEYSENEYYHIFEENFCKNNCLSLNFIGCGISSVVPELTNKVESAVEKLLNIDTRIIHSGLKLNFNNKYKEPLKLGIDRICSVSASIDKYGHSLIIGDFGTATTIEVVNKNFDYLGGIIMPGLKTMVDSLHIKTSQLPEVDLSFPESIIGDSTDSCIKSGVLYGSLFVFETFIKKIQEELGYKCKIIVTGGFSNLISLKTEMIDIIDKYLVLDGIKIIYQNNFI